jgi:DNA-binding NtrC family response regulator
MPNSAPTPGLSILIAEDDENLRELLEQALFEAGHRVTTAVDGAVAASLADATFFDVVVTDIQMPNLDGISLFRRLRQTSPETDVIIMTSHAEISQVVAAMKDGAYDYLAKPFQADDLLVRLGRISSHRALRRELEEARAALSNQRPDSLLIGQSPPMRRLVSLVDTVARSEASVLITGESGTGKELVARMLHDLSPRRDGPFVAVNCSALPEHLVESELFGHERGAFTGAERKRDGRFRAAEGGTLFLDEIAELPLPAQAKLLRVVQERSFEPIGSNTSVQVDVRLLSATHRDLSERIREKLFREDLFYRINVIGLAVPPLRDRPGDLALLVQHFLRLYVKKGAPMPSISPEAWAVLQGHAFPGNVRELSHAIQHAVVLSGGGEIEAQHLPERLLPSLPPVAPVRASVDKDTGPFEPLRPLGEAMRSFERAYLEKGLRQSDGTRAQLANTLGISRKSLWEKLKGYGIASAEDGK